MEYLEISVEKCFLVHAHSTHTHTCLFADIHAQVQAYVHITLTPACLLIHTFACVKDHSVTLGKLLNLSVPRFPQ